MPVRKENSRWSSSCLARHRQPTIASTAAQPLDFFSTRDRSENERNESHHRSKMGRGRSFCPRRPLVDRKPRAFGSATTPSPAPSRRSPPRKQGAKETQVAAPLDASAPSPQPQVAAPLVPDCLCYLPLFALEIKNSLGTPSPGAVLSQPWLGRRSQGSGPRVLLTRWKRPSAHLSI